jgi:hypothetical protein
MIAKASSPFHSLAILKPDHHQFTIAIAVGHKCPTFTMICAYIARRLLGRAALMTAPLDKITEEEFELQARTFLRVVSACTLGLWCFSAGLLIGSFYLF